ncbi:MAG: hypothetical protein GY863_01255 [bacterium]|nr:hypothetical protein [bacterium]
MECPICSSVIKEGEVTVFESLGGKLTRLGVLPIFTGESWRKLRFRENRSGENDIFIDIPLSRSEESSDGQYCNKCGTIIIKGKT